MYVVEVAFEENEPVYKAFSKFEDAEGLYYAACSKRHEEKSSLKSGDFVKDARILKVANTNDPKKAVGAIKENLPDSYEEIKSTTKEDEEISVSIDELLKEHGIIK